MRLIGVSFFLFFFATALNAQQLSVYFDEGKDQISDSAKSNVISFYQTFLKVYDPPIVLRGFSDSTGNSEYNLKLSEKRVNNVKQLLVTSGFSDDKIEIEYYGEVLSANVDQSKNRRVDILLNNDISIYDIISVAEEKQLFEIDPKVENIIEGKEGTKITIPAKSFVGLEKGATVTIELKEYYDFNATVLSNLSTSTTKGEEMITSGMFYINGTSNGEDVKLKKDAELQVVTPEVMASSDVKLYKGAQKDGDIKWKEKSEISQKRKGVAIYGSSRNLIGINNKATTTSIAFSQVESHLRENVIFPEKAFNDKFCGIAVIGYKIDAAGNVVDVAINNKDEVHPEINSHLLRVMSEIGKVKPSYRKDKRALKIDYSITLLFSSDNCKKVYSKSSISESRYSNFFYKEPKSAWANGVNVADESSVNELIFTISSFDWYNIDRLMNYSGPRANIMVKGNLGSVSDVKLVYTDNQMIFPLSVIGNKASIKKVPNANAVLFAVKFHEGKIYCFKQEIDLSEDVTIENPEFIEVTREELIAIVDF